MNETTLRNKQMSKYFYEGHNVANKTKGMRELIYLQQYI